MQIHHEIKFNLPIGKYFWEEAYILPKLFSLLLKILSLVWVEAEFGDFSISASKTLFHMVSINIVSKCPAQCKMAKIHSQRQKGSAKSEYNCVKSMRSEFNCEIENTKFIPNYNV